MDNIPPIGFTEVWSGAGSNLSGQLTCWTNLLGTNSLLIQVNSAIWVSVFVANEEIDWKYYRKRKVYLPYIKTVDLVDYDEQPF